MSELYNVAGVSNPSALLADPTGAEKIAVSVKPGVGAIARGTVLYRNGSLYEAADSAALIATNYLVVLDEAIDSPTEEKTAPVAAAYRAGRLIYGLVKLKDGTAVTAAQALILRNQGIVLDQMAETAPEVTNTIS